MYTMMQNAVMSSQTTLLKYSILGITGLLLLWFLTFWVILLFVFISARCRSSEEEPDLPFVNDYLTLPKQKKAARPTHLSTPFQRCIATPAPQTHERVSHVIFPVPKG